MSEKLDKANEDREELKRSDNERSVASSVELLWTSPELEKSSSSNDSDSALNKSFEIVKFEDLNIGGDRNIGETSAAVPIELAQDALTLTASSWEGIEESIDWNDVSGRVDLTETQKERLKEYFTGSSEPISMPPQDDESEATPELQETVAVGSETGDDVQRAEIEILRPRARRRVFGLSFSDESEDDFTPQIQLDTRQQENRSGRLSLVDYLKEQEAENDRFLEQQRIRDDMWAEENRKKNEVPTTRPSSRADCSPVRETGENAFIYERIVKPERVLHNDDSESPIMYGAAKSCTRYGSFQKQNNMFGTPYTGNYNHISDYNRQFINISNSTHQENEGERFSVGNEFYRNSARQNDKVSAPTYSSGGGRWNDSRDDYREERGAGGSRDYPKQNGGFDGGLGISDRQSFSDWKEPRRSDERRDDREEPYFGQGRRQAPAPASSRHHDYLHDDWNYRKDPRRLNIEVQNNNQDIRRNWGHRSADNFHGQPRSEESRKSREQMFQDQITGMHYLYDKGCYSFTIINETVDIIQDAIHSGMLKSDRVRFIIQLLSHPRLRQFLNAGYNHFEQARCAGRTAAEYKNNWLAFIKTLFNTMKHYASINEPQDVKLKRIFFYLQSTGVFENKN